MNSRQRVELAFAFANWAEGKSAQEKDVFLTKMLNETKHEQALNRYEIRWHPDHSPNPHYVHRIRELMSREIRRPNACMYCECGQQAVWSHTIPRSMLKEMSDNKINVSAIDVVRTGGGLQVSQKGFAEASGFMGFCAKHDSDLFKSFEIMPYKYEGEQHFWASCRSICREIKAKLAGMRGILAVLTDLSKITDENDRGGVLGTLPIVTEMASKFWYTANSARPCLKLKKAYEHISSQSMEGKLLSTVVIELERPLQIASWGIASLENDFLGMPLNLRDFEDIGNVVSFATFTNSEGCFVTLSSLPESEAKDRLIRSSEFCEFDHLEKTLPVMLLNHCELSYFNSDKAKMISKSDLEQLSHKHFPGSDLPRLLEPFETFDLKVRSIRSEFTYRENRTNRHGQSV